MDNDDQKLPTIPDEMSKEEIEQEVLAIIQREKSQWETSTCFVTPRVMFNMRKLIETLRKNYYGVFDVPLDEVSGFEKVWYPLTEILVEAVLNNIDLDTKDVDIGARTSKGMPFTDLTRAALRKELERMGFGDRIDDHQRRKAIDGTAIWKTAIVDGRRIKVSEPDLLNVYIDPTSPSIQEAYRFMERHLMFPDEMQKQNGWINTDGLVATEGLPRVNSMYQAMTSGTSNVKMLDIYELYGKAGKHLITGKRSDREIEVDCHFIVSGIESNGQKRVHLVEMNTEKDDNGEIIKPYEEDWYIRVPGRWYGRGIAEKVIMLQVYANLMFNYRINRGRVAQLGIFKMKKGAGLTPQSIQRLISNGVVQVNNIDDLQQFVIQDISASSYKDEEVIQTLAQKLTNAFDISTGEGLPSSTPATNAAIQNTNAKSGFDKIKESTGLFLERWINRHVLPKLASSITRGEVIQLTSDLDNYRDLVDRVVVYLANEAIDKSYKHGYIPTQEEIDREMDNARMKITRGGDIFMKMVRKVIGKSLEAKVRITNEAEDINKQVSNVMTMIQIAPEYRDDMVKMTFDLMGLPQPAKQAQPQLPGMPQGNAPQSPSTAPTAQPSAIGAVS